MTIVSKLRIPMSNLSQGCEFFEQPLTKEYGLLVFCVAKINKPPTVAGEW